MTIFASPCRVQAPYPIAHATVRWYSADRTPTGKIRIMWTSVFFEKPYAECNFLVAWIKRQIDWNLFFCDKVYTECDFLPGTTKQSSSNYWDRNLFFAGSLRRNAIFLSCATKNSGPLKVDRNLFLREALSKTQDSGANTRLALIIFKRSNGNWIFLRWLARASLSRDCFNSLLAPAPTLYRGPAA